MPFSFPLLVEFFFPGLIAFCAVAFLLELLFANDVATIVAVITSGDSGNVIAVLLIAGLVCYFLGATMNAVSNRVIRVQMAKYRRRMIRRKLGLEPDRAVDNLDPAELQIISDYLPRLNSKDVGDKLNELYAAARTFCSLYSDRTSKTIDYHWSLMRLSRAALLPLMILAFVFLVRSFAHHAHLANAIAFVLTGIQLAVTFGSYCYREKFLIYTVFDTFFESAMSVNPNENGG
ncbi:MAG: hypothetical protein GVY36_19335 [Verrucomicrobia bacterium]|jgi:hypothetical protein|nr:hypothetical protein [Verrucomicrobiota bacterium]